MTGASPVAVVAALCCGIAATSASAGVLGVGTDPSGGGALCGSKQVQYVAQPGERNRVVISEVRLQVDTFQPKFCGAMLPAYVPSAGVQPEQSRSGKFRLQDYGAPVTALAPCSVTGGGSRRSAASCPATQYYSALISTGDGDDKIVIEGRTGLAAPTIDCGPGDDTVIAPLGTEPSEYSNCEHVVLLPNWLY